MRKIPLSNGDFALCDDKDFGLLTIKPRSYPYQKTTIMNWHCKVQGSKKYAIAHLWTSKGWKNIKMHQVVLGNSGIDHKNGNGLDNRRSNLRNSNQFQNVCNSAPKKRLNSTSKFKGVRFEKRLNPPRWNAVIMFNRKSIYLGNFDTEIKAAKAYNKKAKELFGAFAWLNQI